MGDHAYVGTTGKQLGAGIGRQGLSDNISYQGFKAPSVGTSGTQFGANIGRQGANYSVGRVESGLGKDSGLRSSGYESKHAPHKPKQPSYGPAPYDGPSYKAPRSPSFSAPKISSGEHRGYSAPKFEAPKISYGGYGQDLSYDTDLSYGSLDIGYGGCGHQPRKEHKPHKPKHSFHKPSPKKHVHKTTYGPFEYRRPSVEYSVQGPGPKLGVYGPKAKLNIDRATLDYRSKAGDLALRGPQLGNTFKRPDIQAFRPKFDFYAPKLDFQEGRAQTKGPQAKVAGPKPWLGVDGPSADLSVYRPETSYKRQSPSAYVQPAKKHQPKKPVHKPVHKPQPSYHQPSYGQPSYAPQRYW